VKRDPIKTIIDSRVILAPMAGITDIPFRLLARKYGCKFAFTEMVDVNGITHGNIKTLRMLDKGKDDEPIGVQLVGEDEKKTVLAAKICEEKGFDSLDINAACPARKVVKVGKGAALLKDPVKLGALVSAVVKNISIPVTVKIRIGWSSDRLNYEEVAKVVESSGARALAVHSRTQEQMYKGRPDHDVTRRIKEMINIPVFASGNVFEPEDVKNIFRVTGCDAVMVARGVFGRPWIFSEIYDHLRDKDGETKIPTTIREIKKVIAEHFDLMREYYPNLREERLIPRMYKHVCWYLKGFKCINRVMEKYRHIKTIKDLEILMDGLDVDEEQKLIFKENII